MPDEFNAKKESQHVTLAWTHANTNVEGKTMKAFVKAKAIDANLLQLK